MFPPISVSPNQIELFLVQHVDSVRFVKPEEACLSMAHGCVQSLCNVGGGLTGFGSVQGLSLDICS